MAKRKDDMSTFLGSKTIQIVATHRIEEDGLQNISLEFRRAVDVSILPASVPYSPRFSEICPKGTAIIYYFFIYFIWLHW